ncbi:ABC transporter ATP-binding protein [Roseateles asaccharophilus]|uniref:ABC-2 type transport system ATP-binding protein n=1 Tax=Roseateles asaccharophilus TaxID=582607 RepID=A0ABU2A743_9BURK|nr:ABC transporter ATP-binding protein [Roseateles asaccharophilus]MDR7333022.1 ABC-2 type transport system ATP-binding protein [Roseateles asaccharophilus]
MTMAEPLLELQRVDKQYRRGSNQVQALSDYSLALHGGEVLGLLGPNGAGKTTAIKVITQLCEPDAGLLLWRGAPVRDKRYLGRLGVLLEGRGALNERLSTWENARYFCGLREAAFDRAHFNAMAELLELPDPRAPVRLLSTGNKLKSGLLLSLIHRPDVALLDEPTIGLDLFGVRKLDALVRYIAAEGCAVMISSHDLHFVERLAQRIACIRQGRKVFDGAKQDFLRVEHAYALSLAVRDGPPPPLPAGLQWQAPADGPLRLALRDHAELCRVLAVLMPALPAAEGLQVERVTLREKYQALVGNAQETA